MSARLFGILMSLGTLLCLATLVYIMINNDPDTSGGATFFLFYLTLALSVVGFCSVVELIVRKLILKNESALSRQIATIFRQGFMIAIYVIASFIMASYRVLTWWNALILGGFILLIEIIIFTNRKFRNSEYVQ